MSLSLTQQVFLWGFLVAAFLGAIANKTNFCTMGAVSDWVNMGSTDRLRGWLLAMAIAIIVLNIIVSQKILSPEFHQTLYRTENFAWMRYLLGGLIFGIGMTLASGCGNKTLIRFGAGNLKSLFVILIAGFFALLMTASPLYSTVFQPLVEATTINLGNYSIIGQDIGSFIRKLANIENLANARLMSALIVGSLFLIYIFKSSSFRKDWTNIIAGISIGIAVVGAWYITGGPLGQEWMVELEWNDAPPVGVSVQGLTFIGPMSRTITFLSEPSNLMLISFSMITMFGVIFGSFLYAILSKNFRFEWFSSWNDFITHVIGATMMGIGGVLAMGCTIGQGVTGVSTLSLGSFIAVGSMILGSAVTMKTQYYKMVYEDAPILSAFQTALVDLRLLPAKMRKLEDI
jgi:uncharacterized membrane protein YedE/YeeE